MQKPLESLYMIISKRINRKTNLRFFRFYNAIIKIEKVHRETGALSLYLHVGKGEAMLQKSRSGSVKNI